MIRGWQSAIERRHSRFQMSAFTAKNHSFSPYAKPPKLSKSDDQGTATSSNDGIVLELNI